MVDLPITKWIKKKIRRLIGIVEDTDVATHSIASGKYVVWKGDLYKSTAAIAVGGTLSLSNLSPVSDGGFNELSEQIVPVDLSSSITYDTAKIEMYTRVVHKIGSLVVVQLNGLGSSSVGPNDDIVFGLPVPTYQVSFSFNVNDGGAGRGKILRNTGTIRLDVSSIANKYFNISFCYVAV